MSIAIRELGNTKDVLIRQCAIFTEPSPAMVFASLIDGASVKPTYVVFVLATRVRVKVVAKVRLLIYEPTDRPSHALESSETKFISHKRTQHSFYQARIDMFLSYNKLLSVHPHAPIERISHWNRFTPLNRVFRKQQPHIKTSRAEEINTSYIFLIRMRVPPDASTLR